MEPGNTYYFSSFAQNAGGTIFGSIKRLTINPQYAVPFGGVEIANEWYRSPWFGMFKGTNNNWVFHPELGWIYHSNDQRTESGYGSRTLDGHGQEQIYGLTSG